MVRWLLCLMVCWLVGWGLLTSVDVRLWCMLYLVAFLLRETEYAFVLLIFVAALDLVCGFGSCLWVCPLVVGFLVAAS